MDDASYTPGSFSGVGSFSAEPGVLLLVLGRAKPWDRYDKKHRGTSDVLHRRPGCKQARNPLPLATCCDGYLLRPLLVATATCCDRYSLRPLLVAAASRPDGAALLFSADLKFNFLRLAGRGKMGSFIRGGGLMLVESLPHE
ncbi:MAG: hypothetical protein ACM3PY_15515 [Omnitrophica WOR_2 bacterium]